MTETVEQLAANNAESRAQVATAQEYIARLERVAIENFATYRQQGETCDALRADLATAQRQRQAAGDHIVRLREYLVEDAATIEELREDWENAESWAQHYQEVAERKAAKVKRLKKQATALAAEVARLNVELYDERGWKRHYQDRGDALDANNVALAAEVARLERELDATRIPPVPTKTQAIWHANSAGLRLDGAGPEYVTTDADGRITHYGRGRIVAVKAEPFICADDMPDGADAKWSTASRADGSWETRRNAPLINDMPDSDERLTSADELTDIGISYRATDAAEMP